LGHEGRVTFAFFHFYIEHHQNQADFVGVISRGIGINELLVESILIFYGKAIVENENWLSQSMYFFSKESIASLFRKTEGAVHDRDIAGRKLSRFTYPWKLYESEKPLHQITN